MGAQQGSPLVSGRPAPSVWFVEPGIMPKVARLVADARRPQMDDASGASAAARGAVDVNALAFKLLKHAEYRGRSTTMLARAITRVVAAIDSGLPTTAEGITFETARQRNLDGSYSGSSSRAASREPPDVEDRVGHDGDRDALAMARAVANGSHNGQTNDNTEDGGDNGDNDGDDDDDEEEEEEDDDEAAYGFASNGALQLVEVKDSNALNRAMQRRYAATTAASAASTPAPSPPATPALTPARRKAPTPARAAKRPRRSGRSDADDDDDVVGGADDDISNRKKKKSSSSMVTVPTATFADLGGVETILGDLREFVERPMQHPEIYVHLGIDPPRGILLHGPPGCGKTTLARAIAGEMQVPFLSISAPEIVSGMSGESEAKIRELFQSAIDAAPCIVFIDEIDVISAKRENAQREMERRIVAQLFTCMDSLTMDRTGNRMVMLLAATNRPDALDAALRRAGRFDKEICLGVPDQGARKRILEVITRNMTVDTTVDYGELARRTPGYVGADLAALAKEAAVLAVNRIFEHVMEDGGGSDGAGDATSTSATVSVNADATATAMMDVSMESNASDGATATITRSMDETLTLADAECAGNEESAFLLSLAKRNRVHDRLRLHRETLTPQELAPLSINMVDFEGALSRVQPSAKREGFATTPDVTWADVGALTDVRSELETAILQPIRFPAAFSLLGISASGVLLYGPPGCGKTLLAKAVANESGANFISVKGPELLNKYVGESEHAVRRVFQRARASAPCVIFFDELDALCPRRAKDGGGDSRASERVVNQLLTEIDGVDSRRQVFVIGATNRPDIIDEAMMRPGRLDKLLYVPLPAPEGRVQILRTCTRKTPLDPDVDLEQVGRLPQCRGFSGADLSSLVREASVSALRRHLATASHASLDQLRVCSADFTYAFTKVLPSVSQRDEQLYLRLQGKLRGARARLSTEPTASPALSADASQSSKPDVKI